MSKTVSEKAAHCTWNVAIVCRGGRNAKQINSAWTKKASPL